MEASAFVRRVVCAAIRHKGTERIICGARHFDAVMREQILAAEGRKEWLGATQGFIDNMGVFMSREEAYELAEKQNQLFRNIPSDRAGRYLTSETLY